MLVAPTLVMQITWFLSTVALCLSCYALFVVVRSRTSTLYKQLSETGMELERLSLELRNLRSRLNMQAHRERKAQRQDTPETETDGTTEPGDPDPKKDPEAWKRAMNRKLAMRGIPK